MKKFVAIIVVPLLFAITACGGSNSTTESDESVKMSSSSVQDSLNGTWVSNAPIPSDGFNEEQTRLKGASLVAEISDNKIVINWARKDLDWTGVYWAGTFPTDDPSNIVSLVDTKTVSTGEYPSGSNSKTFSYEGDLLTFTLGINDVPHQVYFKRE